jgi:UDP-N-acetyl-D-galactosamine dehydrogenase
LNCISVDPYYFIYKAESLGYHSQIILSGRQINDQMAERVAVAVLKFLSGLDKPIKAAKIAVLGLSFKEDCTDTRNSKIVDTINMLEEYDVFMQLVDSLANKEDVFGAYGKEIVDISALKDIDVAIVAAPHRQYVSMDLSAWDKIMGGTSASPKMIVDVKNKMKYTMLFL